LETAVKETTQRGARRTPTGIPKLRLRDAGGRVAISLPRDWTDLGRWILTEAMQRALADAAQPGKAAERRVIPFPRLVVDRDAAGRPRA
jgi:hypothetical protein